MQALPNVADWDQMGHMIAVEPERLRMPPEIQTQSGSYFNFVNPELSEFTIEDIASALSKLCRFTGHVKSFYSVSQHSTMVSRIVPPKDALAGLLHDASEAFLNDISSPLKQLLSEYRVIEKRVEKVILNRFGLSENLPDSVKRADLIMLATEKRDLMPGCIDSHWAIIQGIDPLPEHIHPLDPRFACFDFLDRFYALTKRPVYMFVDKPHPAYTK